MTKPTEQETELGPDFPSIDTWVAYLTGSLLEEEAEQLRHGLQANPGWQGYVETLAEEMQLSLPAAPVLPLSSRRQSPLAWAAAAAMLLGAVLWFVLSADSASHPVSEDFAKATQLSVIGDPNATVRGASEQLSMKVRPGLELTLAAAVAEDAHALFVACDLNTGKVESLLRDRIETAKQRIAFARYVVPEADAIPRTVLVMLVSQRELDAHSLQRVEALLRTTPDAQALETALRKSFGCVVEVRRLQPAPQKKKVGSLDRRSLRKQVRSLRRLLRKDELAALTESGRPWTTALGLSGRVSEPAHPWWEAREILRLCRLATYLRTLVPHRRATVVAAERRRADHAKQLVLQVATGGRDKNALRGLQDATLRDAATLVRELGPQHLLCARARHLHAKLLLLPGQDPDQAMQELDEVRQLFEAAGETDHPHYGSVLSDMAGACRMQGHLHQARQYASTAVHVYQQGAADPRVLAEALRGLADIHRGLGDPTKARLFADEAGRALAGKRDTEDASTVKRRLHLFLTRAIIEMQAGDHSAANRHLEAASLLAQQRGTVARRATILALQAEVSFMAGDLPRASRHLAELRKLDRQRLGDGHPYLAMDDFLAGRIALARRNWSLARQLLERALTYVEQQIIDRNDVRDRATLASRLNIDAIADALTDAYLATGDSEAAFEVQERARARALLELFAGPVGSPARNQVDELRHKKSDLHFQIEALLTAGATTRPHLERLQNLRKKLATVLQEEWIAERAATSALRKQVPQASPIATRDLPEVLQPSQALCFYAEAEDNLRLFVVQATDRPNQPRQPVVFELARGEDAMREYRRNLAAALQALPRASATKYAGDLKRLGDLLLPAEPRRVLANAKGLVVVPDGDLVRLPFEALVITKAVNWRNCTFLLDALPPITYARSVSSLRRITTTAKPQPLNAAGVLLVGAPELPAVDRRSTESQALAPNKPTASSGARQPTLDRHAAIPETATEVRLIESVLRSRVRQLQTLLGADATCANLLQRVAGQTIVHLASHGRIGDPWRPYAAGIELTPAAGQGDGLLSLGDVVRGWTGSTRLVVLSACESGVGTAGPFRNLSMPAAFHRAGVSSVVASLWKVDSQATVQLMTAFYDQLGKAKQLQPAHSLWRAKRTLRKQFAHPSLWSAFLHFGRMSHG